MFKLNKGSSVVWNRSNYFHEALKQLQNQNIYKDVKFYENKLTNLVPKSEGLCSHKLISEKELKYFTYNFKKATNLRKLYFLPILLRKNWKVAFLLLLPITLRFKSLENWLGTYFLFHTVMAKFKRFSHLLKSHLTKIWEK